MKKQNGFRKLILYITMAAVLVGFFSGCGVQQSVEDATGAAESTDNTLCIFTENTAVYSLIEDVAREFEAEYEGVSIQLEAPPVGEGRTEYLEQLRVQIMAGKGPDIYILPVENTGSDQIFPNVGMCMNNGIFKDISRYYDKDSELCKEDLVSAVMDAGVIDGARYILPLQYNFPVLYVDNGQLEKAKRNLDECLNGMIDIVGTKGGTALAADYSFAYFSLHWLNFLPELIDYEKLEVSISKKELADFLAQYRELMTMAGSSALRYASPSYENYMSSGDFWALDGVSAHLGSLNSLLSNLQIAKATGTDLTVIPLSASDGSVAATVTYYGAIDANCNNPELAYRFLRRFLLAENQWNTAFAGQLSGWPVLTGNSWEEMNDVLWRSIRDLSFSAQDQKDRLSALRSVELTAEDVSVLNTKIDVVHLPFAAKGDFMDRIDSQLNLARNPDAMSVDVAELAEEIIWELELHLAEG